MAKNETDVGSGTGGGGRATTQTMVPEGETPLVFDELPEVASGAGGFNNRDLRALLAGVLNNSLTATERLGYDPYMTVGKRSDVSNVNDFTDTTMTALTTALAGSGTGGRMVGPGGNASIALEAQLVGELGGTGGAYSDSLGQRAREIAGQTYSSGNALYSGAAQQNISDAVTRALTESSTQRIGALSSGLSSLAGVRASFENMNIRENQGIMGLMASLSQNEYFNPTYTQNPNYISPIQAWSLDQTGTANTFTNIAGMLSSGADIAGALFPQGFQGQG